MRSGDSRLRMTTTKSALETTFIVSGSIVLWTSTNELRKFRRLPSKRRIYDFDNLPPRVDLEISALSGDFDIYFHEWT
ncbi:hypothetical protein V1477_016100 [Vespula maculifrons]|uniref:Uncharacterized protein n=1 Tax=Vespula maculifrons TaxID=7453 RepID=A0ABD2BC67_VESMC